MSLRPHQAKAVSASTRNGRDKECRTRSAEKSIRPGIHARHHLSECDHKRRNHPIHLKVSNRHADDDYDYGDGKTASVATAELHGAVWNKSELNRLKAASKVLTYSDRVAEFERSEAQKRNLEEASEIRKKKLRDIDEKRVQKELAAAALSIDHDDDEHSKATLILDRAQLAKTEQEEEVKRANRIILQQKCHVIRNAQIAEKNEIKREHRQEDLRFERIMRAEQDAALKKADEQSQLKKQLNAKHALDIRHQLREREMARISDAERIEEEAEALARSRLALAADLAEKEKKRREKTAKIRSDLQQANELSEHFKNVSFEEQRLHEMRVQEYTRRKHERDEELLRERKLARQQKEREHERLLRLQQKVLETKTEQDDLSLRRVQEEKEREFRQKERHTILQRKKLEQEIGDIRMAQLNEKKRQKEQLQAKKEADFLRICTRLQEEEAEERNQHSRRQAIRDKYRSAIISQMHEKVLKRRELQHNAKIEFHAAEEMERERERNIRKAIVGKLQQMRDNNLPDQVIKDVERHLNATAKSK